MKMSIPDEFIGLRDGELVSFQGEDVDWEFVDPRAPNWREIDFAWSAAHIPNEISSMFFFAFPLGALKPTLEAVIATLSSHDKVDANDLKHALKVTKAMARVKKQTWESRLLVPMTNLALQGTIDHLRERKEGED